MHSRFIRNITPSVKMLIIILLICTLLIAKSIFLMGFITVLSLIILILFGSSVNKYVDFIKKIFIWLLFIVIMYIIIYKSIVGLGLFMYKTTLIAILLEGLISNFNFDELHSGINEILKPFKIFKLDAEKISYNVALNVVFLNELLHSSNRIERVQIASGRRNYRIKYFLFPRLLNSTEYVKNLENSLKLKFYTLKGFKINFKSVLLLIMFIFLFIITIYKEVIL